MPPGRRFDAASLLVPMRADAYFPPALVDEAAAVLARLAARMERERPVGDAAYALTHDATLELNALIPRFEAAGSDLETGARDAIADDVAQILEAHGYDADLERALAARDW